jgi:hypothetical protein
MRRRDDDPTSQLFEYSEGLLDGSRHLRTVSKQLLRHVDDLRQLELRSRAVAIGSPEFMQLSREIAALSHMGFRLSVEQELGGELIPEQSTTLDEMDTFAADDPARRRSSRVWT